MNINCWDGHWVIGIISVIHVVSLYRNLPEQQMTGFTKLWPGSDICCVAVKASGQQRDDTHVSLHVWQIDQKIIFIIFQKWKIKAEIHHMWRKSQELSFQFRSLVTASRLDQPVLSWTILNQTSQLLWFMVLWFYCLILLLIYCSVYLETACLHKFG